MGREVRIDDNSEWELVSYSRESRTFVNLSTVYFL